LNYAYRELPHPENRAYPRCQNEKNGKESMGLSENQFQIRHHNLLAKKRTLGVTALKRLVAKQFATGVSYVNKQVQ
jgi:hypothetical protein